MALTSSRSQLRDHPAGPPAADARGRESGVGRATSEAAEAVSDALRRRHDPFLDRRRRLAGLSLASIGAMGMVAAYQFGLLRRLPEPPLPVFESEKVDASGEAYQYLKTPDAALGLASYAATLVLAGMGDERRAEQRPWIPLALATKVAVDAAYGGYLTAEQASKHRRLCSWCLTAAVASVAALPQVVPEARAAWRALRRR